MCRVSTNHLPIGSANLPMGSDSTVGVIVQNLKNNLGILITIRQFKTFHPDGVQVLLSTVDLTCSSPTFMTQ